MRLSLSRHTLLLIALTLFIGCGDPDATPDGPAPGADTADASGDAPPGDVTTDATPDSLPADARVDSADAGDVGQEPDAPGDVVPDPGEDATADAEPDIPPPVCEGAVPCPGFGEISGECGVVDRAILETPEPSLFVNHLDFGDDPYDDADFYALSAGGREVIRDDNAGGSSLLSEAFAYEVLHRCERAGLLKTETEVVYRDPMGKLTDLLVEIHGDKVGVSVTRAVGFPRDDPYPVEQAQTLLDRKLRGILDSTANVAPEDAWVKQILHVIAWSPAHADSVRQAWGALPAEVRADTVVIVTVTDGDDAVLY